MSRNMTIPSRPAPPPPQPASNKITRYSPATNWDDTPFNPQSNISSINRQQNSHGVAVCQPNARAKKAPPPRPPPPKVVPALKKPGQAQSINILSNLFGQKRNSGSKTPVCSTQQKGQMPTKLPPPPKLLPPPNNNHPAIYGSTTAFSQGHSTGSGTDMQLISFDSPPSSPTFTQKSCSDCISVDSFSSDSNYSSPNNGSMSQAESGFEDDFVSQNEHQRSKATTPASSMASTPSTMKDLWDLSDPFGMPPPVSKPSTYANQNNIYASLGSAMIRTPAVNSKLYEADFVDPLCNGKSVASKVQTVAMPTIIKPSSNGSSQKSTPVHILRTKPVEPLASGCWPSTTPMAKPPAALPAGAVPAGSLYLGGGTASFDYAEESQDSLPSLPMPNIPPPPPPPCVDNDELGTLAEIDRQERREPYGVALYDFNGETDEDLSFKTNDKIYLLKRLNEEWLLGRDRRGCEGMFPANYIEVQVPLPGERSATNSGNASSSSGDISDNGTDSFNRPKVRVLYTFNAETPEDLTIMENDVVTILNQITPEWLYGELHGKQGQFPANFVEYVPANLPPMLANNTGA